MPPTPHSLAASLDLTAAEPLRAVAQEMLGLGAAVFDGGAVERVSTPCLQVLAATALAARERGIVFRLANPSAVLAEAIDDLGLEAALRGEK